MTEILSEKLLLNLTNKRGVAKMLHCSVRQIDFLRKHEGLPSVKVGNLVRFDPCSIEQWVKDREVCTDTAEETAGREK